MEYVESWIKWKGRIYLWENEDIDIRNDLITMMTVLIFTLVWSFAVSRVPNTTVGSFSVFMTLFLGIEFGVKPVMTIKESMQTVSVKKRIIQSVVGGMVIGFICGFVSVGADVRCLLFCVASTLLWTRIAAKFADKASAVTSNHAIGVMLAVLGATILGVNYLK